MRATCWHGKRDMRIERGDVDPSFVVTHRMKLDEAPDGYRMFGDKDDACIKIVMTP